MAELLDNVVLPVASRDDAAETVAAIRPYLDGAEVTVVHVIEKAGGAPDKASVEQREEEADHIFDIVEDGLADATVERDLRYSTDTVDAIFDAAEDADASAIVVSTRGGNRLLQLLTGDVALKLVTENDRPVVVLPHDDDSTEPTPDTEDGSDHG
ncbi:universal stress protein [Haloarculaceae archaeon H-GB2-1]|nr:universal stress protein [Haloarculaceae archaeon H-GB1-1]MEA5409062.1 universal stress protein [Haloarculaceae archaeon H-GB2-1]